MTDNEYIERIANGDQTAFQDLYETYRSKFKGYIRKKYHLSDDDIVDIYQDSCVALWENIRSGKFNSQCRTASIQTYLFKIGDYTTNNTLRHNRVITTDKDLSYISHDYSNPSEDYDKEERRMIIQRIIDKMTEPCNKLLTLFYWEELSCREIVEKTDYKNENSVKSQKVKCMRKIESVVNKELSKEE